jgi:hypothetical protein
VRRAAILVALAACQARLADEPELITAPRIIAVQATPAEVAPGAPLTVRAFVATPDGPAEPALEWAFCDLPKPLGENGVVAPGCVTADLPAAGLPGIEIQTTMPSDACRLFGPELPPQVPGQPPARPRDPDATGGYYQPLRVRSGDQVAFALVRVHCRLAQAPIDVALDFEARYQANQNPEIAALDASASSFTARWETTAAEPYLRFDPATQSLVTSTEALDVTWFASASLGAPTTSNHESDVPGSAPHVWIVLRDTRGGVAVRALP